MRKVFLAAIFVGFLFDLNFLISHAPRVHAQTPSYAAGLDALSPLTLSKNFAGLPPCSKSAGCTGYVLLCNTTNTGSPIPAQCVKLNASAPWRTALALEVEQDTATATSTSNATFLIGTVLVKPSAVDANVTP